jgi:hypothetical protein
VKYQETADQTEPITRTADAPPVPDHLTVLGIETCIHCEGPKSAHRGPFGWCWERTTFFEPGPTRAQLTEALARAEAKVSRLYARGVDTTSALRDARDALGNLSRLSIAVIEDCDAENARLRAVLSLAKGALINSADVLSVVRSAAGFLGVDVSEIDRWEAKCREAHAAIMGLSGTHLEESERAP